jgi:hypothetical protein
MSYRLGGEPDQACNYSASRDGNVDGRKLNPESFCEKRVSYLNSCLVCLVFRGKILISLYEKLQKRPIAVSLLKC